jgi:hypothetical protein
MAECGGLTPAEAPAAPQERHKVLKPARAQQEQQHEHEHEHAKGKLSKSQRRMLCDLKYAREEDCAQEGKNKVDCEVQYGPKDALCIKAEHLERSCLGRSLCPGEFLKVHAIPGCEFPGWPDAGASITSGAGGKPAADGKPAVDRKHTLACQTARRTFDACLDNYLHLELLKSKEMVKAAKSGL